MTAREVTLLGGSPWGFRMHGGHDLHQPLRVSRVNPGSKAAQQGVREGDLISSINGRNTSELTNGEAHTLLRNAGDQLKLGLNQEQVESPKRRIYRSSLQENTSIETLQKTTKTTTTTTKTLGTRIVTETKLNGTGTGTDDTKNDKDFSNQNGSVKTTDYARTNCEKSQDAKSVWSPGSSSSSDPYNRDRDPGSPDRGKNSERDAGIPPVWTPSSAGTSPVAERKEFRPVSFESPILGRRKKPQTEQVPQPQPPWKSESHPQSEDHPPGQEKKKDPSSNGTNNLPDGSYNISPRIVNSHSVPSQGLNTLATTPRLPRAQNPTITLLQKAREGQLPKGAAYLNESICLKNNDTGDLLDSVKKEDNERSMKKTPRKIEGIGPITKNGMPVALRSEVKEDNQAKWYKQMYDSLHRAGKDDDYVTIRYKPRRGEYLLSCEL